MKPLINILLIEDNPGDAGLLREHLAEADSPGFQVQHVDRLKTGLACLDKGGVECVLLDLGLPDSQELDTFLRVQEHANGVPVVILSGSKEDALAIEAVRAGAQDYLDKGHIDAYILTRVLLYAIERANSSQSLKHHSQQLESEAAVRAEEIERSQQLLLALNQVAQAVQLARTPEDVFKVIGREIRMLELQAVVFEVTEDHTHLILAHHTFESRMLSAAEKLAGISARGYRTAIQPRGHHDQVITQGHTIYFKQMIKPVVDALPGLSRPVIKRISAILGIEQGIYAPMRVGEDTIGILVVIGSLMAEGDIPAVTAFANQAAIALENARLYQETQNQARALQESEERLQKLLKTNSAIIYSCLVGSSGVAAIGYPFTFVSRNIETILGYRPEECLGNPDWWRNRIHPDDLPGSNEARSTLFIAGNHKLEYRFMKKDGNYIWLLDEMSLLYDSDNHPTEFVGSWIDITKRKLDEDIIKESEEKYRTLFEAESDTIFLVDETSLQILDSNPAAVQMYGYSHEELLTMRTSDLSDEPEKTRQTIKPVEEASEEDEGKSYFVQVRYHKKRDGTVFPVEISASRFVFRGKKVNISTIRDISERKRMEATLDRRMIESQALSSMAVIVNQSLDMNEMFNRAMDEALKLTKVKAGAIYLLDETLRELVMIAHRGMTDDTVQAASRFRLGESMTGKVGLTGKSKVIDNLDEYPGLIKSYLAVDRIQSAVVVPLLGRKGVVGVMGLGCSEKAYFDAQTVELLVNLGQQIATGVEKARLHEETLTWAAQMEQRVEMRTAELAASETLYRTLFDSQVDGLFVSDMDGRYIDVNPSACQMLGYRREELLGMNVLDVGRRGQDLTSEARSDFLEQLRVIWRQGGKGYQSEFMAKTGKLIPIEMSITPLIYHGQEAVLGAVRDISARLHVEESLKESEEIYRLLAEAAEDFIFIINRDMTVEYVNRFGAAIFNRQPEEVVGKHLGALFPSSAGSQTDALKQVFQSGEPVYRENPFEFPGKIIWLGTRLSPIKDTQGNVLSVLGLARDITEHIQMEKAVQEYSERLEEMVDERTQELRTAQDQLVSQEKLAVLGQLAGGLAHELRTPLNTIKNAAHFLNMVIDEPDADTIEILGVLGRSVDTSDRIITSLLDYARPHFPKFQTIKLDELIESIIKAHPLHENIKLDIDIESSFPEIMADPNNLSIVFSNLIGNAVQAMPEGGELTIQARKNDACDSKEETISVAIIDSGVGMTPEIKRRLFEPLFSTKTKGLGLGLAISKILIDGHHGTISVESEPGRGSAFKICLPTKTINQEGVMGKISGLADE